MVSEGGQEVANIYRQLKELLHSLSLGEVRRLMMCVFRVFDFTFLAKKG